VQRLRPDTDSPGAVDSLAAHVPVEPIEHDIGT